MATTVVHSVGPGKDYSSLAAWQAAQARDLVSLDQVEQCDYYAMNDTNMPVDLTGWTTDATRKLIIQGAASDITAGNRYKFTTERCRAYVEPTSGYAVYSNVRYCDLINIQFHTPTTGSIKRCLQFNNQYTAGLTRVIGCILKTNNLAAHSFIRTAYFYSNMEVYNCLYFNEGGAGSNYNSFMVLGGETDPATSIKLYSNTIIGASSIVNNGSSIPANKLVLRNVVGQSIQTAWYQGSAMTTNCDYCVGNVASVPGAHSYSNISDVAFIDSPNFDYRLDPEDVRCIDLGETLGSPYNVDIMGSTRPGLSAYDIGFYEVVAVPSILLNKTTLTLVAYEGQSAEKTFTIENDGESGSTLNYTITDDAAWLSSLPASGSCTTETDTITVTADSTGLAVGEYSGTITVTDTAADDSPQEIEVTFNVMEETPSDEIIYAENPRRWKK